jgi:hypothetical protein
MRGLYILLTIDNDGGMEVLKYAAHLFQRHPDLYHSRPIQLALSIYKVRIDMVVGPVNTESSNLVSPLYPGETGVQLRKILFHTSIS